MNAIRICLLFGLIATIGTGCFTPSKIRREREIFMAKANHDPETGETTAYAGADVFGLGEAIKADPSGTMGAMLLDGLSAIGTAIAGYFAGDQIAGGSGSSSKSRSAKPQVPNIQADTIYYNAGNNSSFQYNYGNQY